MPESTGPEFPDGPEYPEFTEDELSSVVFDEEFVQAALFHEPSAADRTETDSLTATTGNSLDRVDTYDADEPFDRSRHDDSPWAPGAQPLGPAAEHAISWIRSRSRASDDGLHGRTARWRQAVAWTLALIMGIGVVAVAVTALSRGSGSHSPRMPQPAVGTGPTADTGPVSTGGSGVRQPFGPFVPHTGPLPPAPAADAGRPLSAAVDGLATPQPAEALTPSWAAQ